MLGGSHGQVMGCSAEAERRRLDQQSRLLVADELAFLRRAGLASGMCILDLGCGTGVMSGVVAAHLEADVVGLDSNPDLLPSAPPHRRVSCHIGDAYDLGAYAGAFDAVIVRFMLQHVSDPGRVARQVRLALRPGGIAVAIDSDDGYTVVSPPDAEFAGLLEETRRRQAAFGGDRLVGRRLMGLLSGAGLEPGIEQVRVVTAREVGFPTLFALATGCKASLLGDPEAFAAVGRRIGPGSSDGSGFFSVGIVAASARRPR